MNTVEATIAEPPGGHNHGRRKAAEVGATDPWLTLDTDDLAGVEFMRDSGFAVVDTAAGTHTGSTYGYRDAGMTTHRGVLHPDEYVDHEALVGLVEEQLGFSFDQLHSVYSRSGGPIPAALRPLRDAIDARLLGLLREGANMTQLSQVCGLTDIAVDRAVARAKAAEVQA